VGLYIRIVFKIQHESTPPSSKAYVHL